MFLYKVPYSVSKIVLIYLYYYISGRQDINAFFTAYNSYTLLVVLFSGPYYLQCTHYITFMTSLANKDNIIYFWPYIDVQRMPH